MSDINSSLPIRTESAGDVISKIADATNPNQQLAVGADGSINITDNGGSITVDGTVELGATTLAALESITVQNPSGAGAVNIQDGGNSITVDGTVDLGASTLAALESITVQNPSGAGAVNIQDGGNSITVDGTVELGATTLAALESISVQNGAGAAAVNIQDGGNSITVDAVDLDIRDLNATQDKVQAWLRDEAGVAFSSANPLPVVMLESEGAEVNDYATAAAVAGGANSTHDYAVTAGKTLQLTQIEAAASGKMKIEVQIESGVGTNTFATKFVKFNSTSEPGISIALKEPISVAAGVKVRVIRTNRDNQAQDVYSTISGHEV